MRKLFLASIGFSVGENHHTEQRLICIDVLKGMTETEEREQACQAATIAFKKESEPLDRIWKSTIVPPVLGFKDSVIVKEEPKMMVDVWYKATDIPPKELMHNGTEYYQTSRTVVIDVNGDKSCYAIGFYDFENHKWRLDNKQKLSFLTPDMKWRTI